MSIVETKPTSGTTNPANHGHAKNSSTNKRLPSVSSLLEESDEVIIQKDLVVVSISLIFHEQHLRTKVFCTTFCGYSLRL